MYGDAIQEFKFNTLYPALVQRDRHELCNAGWIQNLYARRVAYFYRYPGFEKEAFEDSEEALPDDEPEELTTSSARKRTSAGSHPSPDPSHRSGDTKKHEENHNKRNKRDNNTKFKPRLIDISGEYSD